MVVNLCGIIFLGLEKLVADLVWKLVAWTLVHWISQLSKLLVQQENITLRLDYLTGFFHALPFFLPCDQRVIYLLSKYLLSIYAMILSLLHGFSINEVVHVTCQSRCWFVLHTPEHIKQTNYATDQWREWRPKQLKPCKREASAHRAFVPRFTLICTKGNF